METLEPRGSAAPDIDDELPHFLLERDRTGDWPRWKRAAVGSGAFHVVAITALILFRSGPVDTPPPENLRIPEVIHLYIPKDLTQKAPNKEPVAKLMVSTPSAPATKVTEPVPQPKQAPPPPPPPKPVQAAVTPPAAPVVPPAPTQGTPPPATLPPVALPKPDAPKMIVEDSLQLHPQPKPGGSLTAQGNGVEEALRSLSNSGTAGGTRAESTETAVGAGLHLPANAARLSSLNLKSDPMGVDFQPYLQQVLAAVKLNWVAVFPTAARLGQRGVVSLEFAIVKDGNVAKIVFNGTSGSKALDNASVAAISASNPLPPLPKDFKGDRIVLQMSFMYNIPR